MDRTIAYLTSFYARAGDTFIRREVEELRRRGFTVHTFSIRRADDGEAVSEDIFREQRTTNYVLEHGPCRLVAAFLRSSLRSPARMIRAVLQAMAMRPSGLKAWLWHWVYLLEASYLAEEIRRRDVELLHDHIAMSSATVAMLASCISGVPFSMTVHGLELLSAEQWALARKIAASAATVCVSSFGRGQCMLATAPEHWHKLHVIRCGLDGTFLNAVSLPVPDVPRLVCIGRLSPEKGQVLLVHAAAQIRQRGMMAEIVLVGDGPSRSVIERAARELAVDDLVRLVGWQSSEDVRRWIQSSRALVVPSFSEGIPVVLLEAMALERPVIATHVGGVSELVRRRENGWLVPAGSVEDLAAAILEALGTSVQELRRMGQRGRQLILEQHDLATEVGKLVELFERAMRRDPRPRAARNSRRESP